MYNNVENMIKYIFILCFACHDSYIVMTVSVTTVSIG